MNKNFQRKIVYIFLPIKLNMCYGAKTNRLIETVLLSTHNICFGCVLRKIIFCYALLSGGLNYMDTLCQLYDRNMIVNDDILVIP